MRSVLGHEASLAAILQDLMETATLEGAAVLDLSQPQAPITCTVGSPGPDTIAVSQVLLSGSSGRPVHAIAAGRRPILACPMPLPPARFGGLLMWRAPRTPAWTEADHALAASVAMLLRRTLAIGFGQIGIDPLTGIPNRRWFIDEADRRIDRLDRDEMVGTLTLIDVDDLDRLNSRAGRTEGDRVLVRLASQLRGVVRPSDLVARTGEDEFALWQDGMDHLTAAERADMLSGRALFNGLASGPSVILSIGIATRWPGSGEDVRTLLRRAHVAVREVKNHGGGGWRVSRTEMTGR